MSPPGAYRPGSDPRRIPDILRDLGLTADDLDAWTGSGLPDDSFEEWVTDRVARRPSGQRAREVYGGEDAHDFARRAILGALALGPADRLVEVGCGGGLLLRDALATGATATGVDHSPEMATLARTRAPRSDVVLASADRLPFREGAFTAAAMSMVLQLLPDPAAALGECHRVLADGGRLAVYTTAPELRGTPAAPEPLASRIRFYASDELADLAHAAGFASVSVSEADGGQLLTGLR